jgi:hypothetical protein
MIEARGTAVETEIPLASKSAQALEVAENPLKYANRLLGGLGIEWQVVHKLLHTSARNVDTIKQCLREGRMPRAKYVNGFTGILKITPEDLANVISRHNRENNKDD